MFHSLDCSPLIHKYTSLTMTSQKEPELGPHGGEYSTPSSFYSPGITPFQPTTAEEIIAMPSPGFEAALNTRLPDTPTDSRKNSDASNSKDKGKEKAKEEVAAGPAAAARPLTEEELGEAIKDATDQKKKEKDERERIAWITKWEQNQPGGKLLKLTDPEYIELKRGLEELQREARKNRPNLTTDRTEEERPIDRERTDHETGRTEEQVMSGANDDGKEKGKFRRIISRMNLPRRLSHRSQRA